MGKRKLLKAQDRLKLFNVPADEDSLIRYYSLSPADRLEVGLRRREHNQLSFAVQLCLMRYPGRVLAADETPPRAMLKYVAEQLGAEPGKFAHSARREETRRDHTARLMVYLGTRSATGQDRRAALLAAIQAATMSDDGCPTPFSRATAVWRLSTS
jgi:TnpA family transposase